MTTKTSALLLHLPISIKAEAERLSAEEGISLNQFVASAVAEKLSALRGTQYFAEHKERVDWVAFDQIMARTDGDPPREGDELPEGWSAATNPPP